MKKILVYGDANLDIFVSGKREIPAPGTEEYVAEMPLTVGGGAALVAMGLGKLNAEVSYAGVLSTDMIGQMITESMKKVGVDLSKVVYDKSVGSGISISFTSDKDRSFISYAGSIAENDIGLLTKIDLSDIGHVHITGYDAKNHDKILSVLKYLKETAGVTVSYDVAFDETGLWNKKIVELMEYVDVFFMNEVEAMGYSGKNTIDDASKYFSNYGNMVIKAGKSGAYYVKRGEKPVFQKANEVKTVDTTGAGDSFNAGFLWGYVNKLDDDMCLKCGNYCGGRCVTAKGGNTAFPLLEELKKALF